MLTHDQIYQSGFALPVLAENDWDFALQELHVDALEDGSAVERLAQVFNMQITLLFQACPLGWIELLYVGFYVSLPVHISFGLFLVQPPVEQKGQSTLHKNTGSLQLHHLLQFNSTLLIKHVGPSELLLCQILLEQDTTPEGHVAVRNQSPEADLLKSEHHWELVTQLVKVKEDDAAENHHDQHDFGVFVEGRQAHTKCNVWDGLERNKRCHHSPVHLGQHPLPQGHTHAQTEAQTEYALEQPLGQLVGEVLHAHEMHSELESMFLFVHQALDHVHWDHHEDHDQEEGETQCVHVDETIVHEGTCHLGGCLHHDVFLVKGWFVQRG